MYLPVIALLLLARELLGHRLDRELAGPGTLSLNRRKCRLVQIRNEPAHARACGARLPRDKEPCKGDGDRLGKHTTHTTT